MVRRMMALGGGLLLVAVLTACSGDDGGDGVDTGSDGSTTTTADGGSTTSTAGPTTTGALSEDAALTFADGVYTLTWDALANPAYFAFDETTLPGDPFWHIHTDAATDGFYLSLELYTTGYGTSWTGETGEFAIDCTPEGTGICLHLDPADSGDIGADFEVTGTAVIDQLDESGYAITLTDVAFSDGSTIAGPVELSG